MRRPLTGDTQEQILQFIQIVGEALGNKIEGVHVITPYVCDNCKNDDKEAFPYHVYDAQGKFWHDLCNDCYDDLGCRYDWMDI